MDALSCSCTCSLILSVLCNPFSILPDKSDSGLSSSLYSPVPQMCAEERAPSFPTVSFLILAVPCSWLLAILPAPGSALNRDVPAVLIHGPTVVVPQCWYRPAPTSRCKASDGQCALLTPLYLPKAGMKAVKGNCLVAKLISSRLSLCYHFCGALERLLGLAFPQVSSLTAAELLQAGA